VENTQLLTANFKNSGITHKLNSNLIRHAVTEKNTNANFADENNKLQLVFVANLTTTLALILKHHELNPHITKYWRSCLLRTVSAVSGET